MYKILKREHIALSCPLLHHISVHKEKRKKPESLSGLDTTETLLVAMAALLNIPGMFKGPLCIYLSLGRNLIISFQCFDENTCDADCMLVNTVAFPAVQALMPVRGMTESAALYTF